MHFLSRTWIFSALAAINMLMLWSCGEPRWREASGAAWGTSYAVTYKSADDLADSVVAVMRKVEGSLSMFDPQSTVSRINAGDTSVRADTMFRTVFARSQYYSRLSDGMFDPTVARLVDLWGFGRRQADDAEPDSDALARAMRSVGIARCSITPEGRVLRCDTATAFDFSAIAKGWGVDCVAAMLRRNGCKDYMVEIGGEVAMAGVNPKGKLWRVQIDHPLTAPDAHRRLAVVSLTDCALATSGNYRRHRTLADGSVVSHTLSPLTGHPVLSNVLSVTVAAPDCIDADALATACMAMPVAQSQAMIEGLKDVSALYVLGAGRDSVTTQVVGRDVFKVK